VSWHVRVIANRYADSVRLMGVARTVRDSDGVGACEVVMGTPANVGALSALGVDVQATPADIVIAVDADSAEGVLDRAEQALAASGGAARAPEAARPRSLAAAARELDGANVALISVPGDYATLEAHRALSEGMHVFLFSDRVSVADELELKRRGAELGLLVMGPECGTAMLGGIGLGFANVVRPGSVGIVAAAGTGAQESACLIDAAGAGVAQIVGVGGRDLSEAIGGIMFRQAMAMLGASDDVDTLLLVSKEPTPAVVRTLGESAPDGVRLVGAFVGWAGGEAAFEVHPTLEAAAGAAAGGALPAAPPDAGIAELRERALGGPLLGLFSGGSLAHEAATIARAQLGPIGGNVGEGGGRHAIFDLGTEEYTRGRPHPMVDLGARLEMLEDAAAGCVLLDVVLGHGAHPDPASELAPAIERVEGVVVAHVCGTDADPQDASRQAAALAAAGTVLAASNAAAARLAVEVVR
jgi:FdrA protein